MLQHPVYCLKVVGTQNAHNLISISTDGKMCSWSLDMLSQPQETLELQNKQSKQIAVTQLAFPSGDVNNFVVGSEDGTVYSGTYFAYLDPLSRCVTWHYNTLLVTFHTSLPTRHEGWCNRNVRGTPGSDHGSRHARSAGRHRLLPPLSQLIPRLDH